VRASAPAGEWFVAATSSWSDWDLATLLAAKGGQRVSVVIPARDEAPTIGEIVAAIRGELMEDVELVDELVVIDFDRRHATE
jgi:glucosyl-3-phosphoglycerate synthase